MTAINQTITIWAGDDTAINTTVLDSNGVAVDITGALRIQWTLKRSPYETTIFLTKTLIAGIAVVSATAGTISITLSEADTQDLVPGQYYHELRLEDISSEISTISTGLFIINPSQTVA